MSSNITSTFKHALIYSASGIVGKAVGFVMLPIYAHYLRGEGYGIIGMIDVVLSVLTLLIGYGIQGAMSRFYYEKKTSEDRNVFVSTVIITMFMIVILVSSPVLLFNQQVAWLAFGREGTGIYIIIAIFTFMAEMTGKNAEVYILVQQKSIFYSIISFLKLFIGLSLNIYFIVYLKMGVLGYLYSGLTIALLFSTIVHVYALYHVGFAFNKDEAKMVLKFALPLLPGYIAMFIRTNTDRILLRSFLGLTELGAFEMLFKFATLIGVFVVAPFSKIWGVKRFEIADTPEGPTTMARVFTLQLSILLFLGLILSVEIPILLKILTPKEFWLSGSIAALAVFSRIINASYYHFFFGLLYSKKTIKISYIQSATTVVNVIFALSLIKPFGIAGAVTASCLTNIFQCIVAYRMAKPYYYIPFEWRRLLIMLSTFFVLTAAINLFSLNDIDSIHNWLIGTALKPVESIMMFLRLDGIKNGKLIHYTINNLPLIVDGTIKFSLSFIFVIFLVAVDIIPKDRLLAIVKFRSLKPVVNIKTIP